MEYNYFGCTQDNIIASFSGAISGDFATSVYSASTVLTQELDFAESQVSEKLGSGLLQAFDLVEGITPKWNGSAFVFPPELPYLSDLRVWVISENVEQTATSLGNYCNSTNANCPNFSLESLTETPVTVDVSGAYFTVDNYTYNPDDRVYINYKVDKSLISIPSLAGLVRDIVCCQVGSNLYSKEDTEWKLVTRFCERASQRLEYIDENYLPAELKKYEWYKRPVLTKGGITSIRIARS